MMLQSKGHAVNFLKFQELFSPYFVFMHLFHKILCGNANSVHSIYICTILADKLVYGILGHLPYPNFRISSKYFALLR